MEKKRWIIFGVVVVLLLGGLVIYSRLSSPTIDVSNVNTNEILSGSKDSGNIADNVQGNAKSKVILVEYGDFECPYCQAEAAPISQVVSEYSSQIAFVFRDFPLTTIHANARAAAATAEAAGLQGKFWQMHDLLYQNQSSWENLTGDDRTNAFADYANQLGLDMTKYNAALANGATQVNQKISFDQALGKKLGVDSTPTLYLDGTQLAGTINGDLQNNNTSSLKAALNSELKKAGIALPSGES